MFTVSDTAAAAIRQVVTGSGVPPGAGLRITAGGDGISLRIAVSPTSQPGDTVIEVSHDAPLFVAEDAEELLEDRAIDARTDDAGRTQFLLDSTSR